MKLKKSKKKEKTNQTDDFEIIIGDDSNLTISDVENYMGDLRPKKRENTKKLVIPKNKKKNGWQGYHPLKFSKALLASFS